MAGLTHSAFRRLVADFGGYGALWTEMLSGRWLLHENLRASPSVKRRPEEGLVVYQVMISDPSDAPAIMDRLGRLEPRAVDLNCACPAPSIRSTGAGSALLEDRERLGAILAVMRQRHNGPLTVKIRLGLPREDWRDRLLDRFRLFEDCGVDAVVLHPRFSDEKLKRRARHELYGEFAAATRLPIIATGDILGPQTVEEHAASFARVSGVMVGRMAVAQPWIFRDWLGPQGTPDYLEAWKRLVNYALEDFPPRQAFYRVRAFTMYYSRNFHFGHTLEAAARAATDLETLTDRAVRFLGANPQPARLPSFQGLA